MAALRRLRAATLLAVSLVLVVSCARQRQQSDQKRATPFVFQALNLRQQDAQGRLQWRVTSPEARYDLSRHLALARQLQGEIHGNGRPLYQVLASHGTVVNDGQVIQLEGDVRIERRGTDPVTISASRMRWYPREQRIALDRGARATTPQLVLQARQATLLLAEDRLELRGEPRLERRQPAGATGGWLTLRVRSLDWSPGSGALVAQGPVQASEPDVGGAPRTLQAAGLLGNTLQRRLLLQAPVRLTLPDRRAWLQAQQTTINLIDNTVRSAGAFSAAVAALQIRGDGFDLALDQTLVTVSSGCRLVQADASLQANSCRWNWQNQQVQANGGVVLRRSAQQQVTRAASLSGRLGADGLLVLRAPGSKVRSTLRLPATPSPGRIPSPAIRP